LTSHITKFLLELGQGFAFIGRQYHFEIGEQDFYADLLFYHTKLHAYIVVELKARPFEPGDASQLNFFFMIAQETRRVAIWNCTIIAQIAQLHRLSRGTSCRERENLPTLLCLGLHSAQ